MRWTRSPTRTFGTLDEHGTRAGRRFRDDFSEAKRAYGHTNYALCAIIAASMGSTLTIRREPQLKQVDVGQFLFCMMCIIMQNITRYSPLLLRYILRHFFVIFFLILH